MNIFTGAVIAVLMMVSVILTATMMFPRLSGGNLLAILCAGVALARTWLIVLRGYLAVAAGMVLVLVAMLLSGHDG